MIRRSWWLLPAAAAVVLTVLTLVVLPPDRTINNLGEFLFRIAPIVLAILAIAGFPQRPGVALLLLVVVIVGYMGMLDTLNIIRVMQFANSADRDRAFPKLYQVLTFIDAFTAMAILFGYRLGGGSTARVLRLGFAFLLVIISGLNDLTFFYSYNWPRGRPPRLDWASHIQVFIGHPPKPGEAIVFCAMHLVLAAAILAVPALLRRRRPPAEPAAGEPAPAEPLEPVSS